MFETQPAFFSAKMVRHVLQYIFCRRLSDCYHILFLGALLRVPRIRERALLLLESHQKLDILPWSSADWIDYWLNGHWNRLCSSAQWPLFDLIDYWFEGIRNDRVTAVLIRLIGWCIRTLYSSQQIFQTPIIRACTVIIFFVEELSRTLQECMHICDWYFRHLGVQDFLFFTLK